MSQDDVIEGEIISSQLSEAEKLPSDLVLLRMENAQIFSMAKVHPRDPIKIMGELQTYLDAYPAAAAEAIYKKPVGTVYKVTCAKCRIAYEVVKVERDTVCPNCKGASEEDFVRPVKKYAEGLSVRSAETIRSVFGYTRQQLETEILEDGKVKLTGVLVDYAAGNITSDVRIVTPFYKAATGKMARTPEDRFLNVVVKAEKSKLKRDIILDSVPGIVKALFRDACEKKLAELVTPELLEQIIFPEFLKYGLNKTQVEQLVGSEAATGWTVEDRATARKILSGLKNEETTAAELIAGLESEPGARGSQRQQASPAPAAPNGNPTADELAQRPIPGKQPATQQAASTGPKNDAELLLAVEQALSPPQVRDWFKGSNISRAVLDLAKADGINAAVSEVMSLYVAFIHLPKQASDGDQPVTETAKTDAEPAKTTGNAAGTGGDRTVEDERAQKPLETGAQLENSPINTAKSSQSLARQLTERERTDLLKDYRKQISRAITAERLQAVHAAAHSDAGLTDEDLAGLLNDFDQQEILIKQNA